MFLSIIIPVYKVEAYLRECLDSIAASPLDCWEAILIDDGSPDRCPQICDEYAAKDSRFRVIHQDNAGVAAARNAGLDAAQGEWIWFVDSDDVVDMRPVGEMMEWINDNVNENENDTKTVDVHVDVDVPVIKKVDLVMFDLVTFDDNEDTSYDTLKLRNTSLRYADATKMVDVHVDVPVDVSVNKNGFLMNHICYHHPRLWYRRRCLDHHQRPLRFTRGIRLAEDLEFQYKYLTICEHPVKFDVTLYYYRLRNNSATGDVAYRQRAVEDLPVVLKNLAIWTKENDIKPEPWYDYRIMKMLQNLLYSAEKVYETGRISNDTQRNENDNEGVRVEVDVILQKEVREIVKEYRDLGFSFVKKSKIMLATWSVKAYFLFNRSYLKIKGFQ